MQTDSRPALPTGSDPAPSPVPPLAFPTGSDAQNGHLRGLILQKEKELHDINEYRIHTLENLVGDKEKDISEHKARLQKMKDDFCFNLKLLEERDAELERYDASFSSLKAVVRERDQELSELKIATAELQHNVKQEAARAAEAESYYQQKVAQLREEGEAGRWKRDDELRTQRDEFESLKRDFVRQVRELQDTLERERREAASGFEAASLQREKEHGRRVEELQEKLRQAESAEHTAERGLAESRAAQVSAAEKAETLAAKLQRGEGSAEEFRHDVARREARDAARVEELERDKGRLTRAKQAEADEYEARVADLSHQVASLERLGGKQREQAELGAAQLQAEAQQAAARQQRKQTPTRTLPPAATPTST